MKTKIFFLCLQLLIVPSFVQAQATLKESIDFIISKLNGKEVIYWKNGNTHSNFEMKYLFDYTQNILTVTKKGLFEGVQDEIIEKIPFKALNASAVEINEKVIKDNDYWEDRTSISIILRTTDNAFKITRSEKYGDKNEEGAVFEVYLPIPPLTQSTNPDIANRLVKAFQNAIKLCGGKVEKF